MKKEAQFIDQNKIEVAGFGDVGRAAVEGQFYDHAAAEDPAVIVFAVVPHICTGGERAAHAGPTSTAVCAEIGRDAYVRDGSHGVVAGGRERHALRTVRRGKGGEACGNQGTGDGVMPTRAAAIPLKKFCRQSQRKTRHIILPHDGADITIAQQCAAD